MAGLGSDQHLLTSYGDDDSSWTLGYNLFADKWLGTGVVEQSVCTYIRSSSSHLSTFFRYMMDTALTLTTSRHPAPGN